MDSSKRSLPTLQDVIDELTGIRAAVEQCGQSLISQIDIIFTMLLDSSIVLTPTNIAFLWGVVGKMGPYAGRIESDRAGSSDNLLDLFRSAIHIINWAKIPLAPSVPRQLAPPSVPHQSASPVVPRHSAPPASQIPVAPVVSRHSAPPAAQIPAARMKSSNYNIAVQSIVAANPNGGTDVYTNMLDLLERLSLKEKPAVFAELVATVCTAAQENYLYYSCASLLDRYNTGDFCIDCNAERLPGTGRHKSWQYGLCADCIAARNSGAAPIPVVIAPVARQTPPPAAPHPADAPPCCSMCGNGKYPSIYKICQHMPPVCIRCMQASKFRGKELCRKDNCVFCEKCNRIHPYTPRH